MRYHPAPPESTFLNKVIRTLTDPDALNDEIYADVVLRVLELKAAGDPAWMELDRERGRMLEARQAAAKKRHEGKS